MADKPTEQTPTQKPGNKREAVEAYYNAKTREERAAVVKKYPELAKVFSEANH